MRAAHNTSASHRRRDNTVFRTLRGEYFPRRKTQTATGFEITTNFVHLPDFIEQNRHGVDRYPFRGTYGVAGGGRRRPDLRRGHGTGQGAHRRHLAGRHVRLLRGNSGRSLRTVGRRRDARICRKLRTGALRLLARIAGGAGLFQFVPPGRRATQPTGTRRHSDRHLHDDPPEPHHPRSAPRDDGRPVRRDDQHAGAGCGAADAQPVGNSLRRSGAELRGDLSAGCRRSNPGHSRDAPPLGAAVRPGRDRIRRHAQHLHRSLPGTQSRHIRHDRARGRTYQPHPPSSSRGCGATARSRSPPPTRSCRRATGC